RGTPTWRCSSGCTGSPARPRAWASGWRLIPTPVQTPRRRGRCRGRHSAGPRIMRRRCGVVQSMVRRWCTRAGEMVHALPDMMVSRENARRGERAGAADLRGFPRAAGAGARPAAPPGASPPAPKVYLDVPRRRAGAASGAQQVDEAAGKRDVVLERGAAHRLLGILAPQLDLEGLVELRC